MCRVITAPLHPSASPFHVGVGGRTLPPLFLLCSLTRAECSLRAGRAVARGALRGVLRTAVLWAVCSVVCMVCIALPHSLVFCSPYSQCTWREQPEQPCLGRIRSMTDGQDGFCLQSVCRWSAVPVQREKPSVCFVDGVVSVYSQKSPAGSSVLCREAVFRKRR